MKIQSIQSAVIVLAVALALGVTLYIHYSAWADPIVNRTAQAGPWGC